MQMIFIREVQVKRPGSWVDQSAVKIENRTTQDIKDVGTRPVFPPS